MFGHFIQMVFHYVLMRSKYTTIKIPRGNTNSISNRQLDSWSQKGCFTVQARWCKMQAQDISLPIRQWSKDLKHLFSGNGPPKLQGQHVYTIVKKYRSQKVVRKWSPHYRGPLNKKVKFINLPKVAQSFKGLARGQQEHRSHKKLTNFQKPENKKVVG